MHLRLIWTPGASGPGCSPEARGAGAGVGNGKAERRTVSPGLQTGLPTI
jgi:hypothetical protein